MNSSFCKECREKCKFFDSDADSEDYSSDTSSEYYRDSSDESTELPIDLTGLSISDSSTDESTEILMGSKVSLEAGDIIKASAAADNAFSVIATITEDVLS